jgi:hypothetical protein
MTVRELRERMDAEEFVCWQAFDRLEPLGADADDYRAGLVAATLINVNRRRGAPPVRPFDLFPWRAEPTLPKLTKSAFILALKGR